MPILDIQKRARELGRIRIGQVVATTKRDGTPGTRPEKLDRFRLTSHSRPLLEKVAALYGGQVTEWQPQGGGAQAWEVVTDSKRLPIMVPPQPISQWYEFWTGGGCKHRCDGHTNVLTDELCDPEDYGHIEALKRPTTRLNVVLRDVEGIGVWRLETHGINAAMELPDAAAFLASAGGYVNGWISLEPRTSKAEVPDRDNGGTKIVTRNFHVPIIEIDVTPAELMAGGGRVATPTLEGPVQPKELEAGPDPYADLTAQVESATQLEELAAIWDHARADSLVGSKARPSARLDAFTAGWKAKAHEIKDAQTDGNAGSGPGGEQTVEGEIVDKSADAGDPGADADADQVWQQILAAAGGLETPMSLPQVQADFQGRYGMAASVASAAELQVYLDELKGLVHA